MFARASVLVAVSLTLAGCSGVSYVLENYKDIEVKEVLVEGDDTYRVFDKPAAGKMMVTSSLSAAAGQGAIKGLTLYAVDAAPPKPRFQKAAETYLVNTGREGCRILDGYLLINPQWEFVYDCSKPAVAPAKKPRRG